MFKTAPFTTGLIVLFAVCGCSTESKQSNPPTTPVHSTEPTTTLDPLTTIWESVLSRFDANKDGTLTNIEMGLSQLPPAEFALMDFDRDGKVDHHELSAHLSAVAPRKLVSNKIGTLKKKKIKTKVLDEAQFEAREKLFEAGQMNSRQSGPPNVLLISLDTVRADRTTMYGYTRNTTPGLAAFAKGGVTFLNAFNNGNESLYSHASIFSGKYPSEVAKPVYKAYGVPPAATLIPEILKLYGYQTGAFVAGGHLHPDFGHDQGYDTFSSELGFASLWNTTPKALEWIDKTASDKPWFLFVHGYDTHDPFTTTAPFYHLYGRDHQQAEIERIIATPTTIHRVRGREFRPGRANFFEHPAGFRILSTNNYAEHLVRPDKAKKSGEWRPPGAEEKGGNPQGARPAKGIGEYTLSSKDIAHIGDHYDSCLAYADLQLSLFLRAMKARDLLSNTLIIVLSDHGEELMDHGLVNHRAALYDGVVAVPTIIVGPGFEANTTFDGLVESRDILPTILGAAGAEIPAGLQGRDLALVAKGTAKALNAVYFEGVMDMIAVRTTSHKLIYTGPSLADKDYIPTLQAADLDDEHFELYALGEDPNEQQNLINTIGAESMAQTLKDQLIAWRQSIKMGTHLLPQSAVSPEVRKQMQDQGYWKK